MLILASASQSRKKLLENCQIEFLQISSNFDESSIKDENISNLALKLSFNKANSLSKNFQKISKFPKFLRFLKNFAGIASQNFTSNSSFIQTKCISHQDFECHFRELLPGLPLKKF